MTAQAEIAQFVPGETLDLTATDIEQVKVESKYCVTEDIHDDHVAASLGRNLPPVAAKMDSPYYDPIAIACSGPSLKDNVEEIRRFTKILTCSGAHDFLIEHGVVPTWHMEADPRQHKSVFVQRPHRDVQYLISSCCHPAVFDALNGYDVRLWHALSSERRRPILATMPRGHWSVTGGSNVGMRALVLARLLGYTNLHVFGMDCSADDRAFHIGNHPNEPKKPGHLTVSVAGRNFTTSQVFLFYAQQFFKETLKLPDVQVTLHGEGLLQALAAQKMSNPEQVKRRMLQVEPATTIALMDPATISQEYAALNRKLHEERHDYGSMGSKWADVVIDLRNAVKAESILDYGCGKGALARKLPFPIWEYDPAIPGKDDPPRPADLVICADVLEHIEPEMLQNVLRDIARCTLKVGYFVIHTGPASKTLPDGRNTHLIQQPVSWWRERLSAFFEIAKIIDRGGAMIYIVVGPKKVSKQVPFVASRTNQNQKPLRRWQILEQLVNERGWTHGAEIGVKEGFTFLHLLAHCPSLHLTGIDLFEPRPGLEAEGGESHMASRLPEHEKRLRATIAECYAGRATLIKGLSTDTAAQIPDGSLDFAFIDADHREAAVRADILAWRAKIRFGGMLIGHDAQPSFPGVLAAINDLCPGWIQHADSVWSWPIP